MQNTTKRIISFILYVNLLAILFFNISPSSDENLEIINLDQSQQECIDFQIMHLNYLLKENGLEPINPKIWVTDFKSSTLARAYVNLNTIVLDKSMFYRKNKLPCVFMHEVLHLYGIGHDENCHVMKPSTDYFNGDIEHNIDSIFIDYVCKIKNKT